MTEPRNHHFVPQCYLKGFAEHRDKNARLYAWDLARHHDFKTKPKKVAAERDFNRVDVDGLEPNILERNLGEFERALDAALGRTIEARSFQSEDDYIYILNFLSVVAVHHPDRRDAFAKFKTDMMQMHLEFMLSTRQRWESHVNRARASGEVIPEVDYDEVKKQFDRKAFRLVADSTYLISLEMQNAEKVLPYIFKRTWTLFRTNPTNAPFITSDNPAVLVWPRSVKNPPFHGPGFGNGDIIFPVSKELLLFGSFENRLERIVEVGREHVAGLNAYQLAFARSQVYAPHAQFNYTTHSLPGLRQSADIFQDWPKLPQPLDKSSRHWD